MEASPTPDVLLSQRILKLSLVIQRFILRAVVASLRCLNLYQTAGRTACLSVLCKPSDDDGGEEGDLTVASPLVTIPAGPVEQLIKD